MREGKGERLVRRPFSRFVAVHERRRRKNDQDEVHAGYFFC